MDNDDRPKGPRTGPAHHNADALLRVAKVKCAPVKISSLVEHVRANFKTLTIMFSGTKGLPPGIGLPDGVYALTHKYGNDLLIAYNENVAINRQKFSVAHELGHLYMGHVHGGKAIDLDSKADGEIEANQFAAQLLMPTKFLRADIKSGVKDVPTLAGLYEVSEDALWWRLSETGLLKLL